MSHPTHSPDEQVMAYAGWVMDLARSGACTDLVAELDAGLPVNLTNQQGDTLLILAAYYRHADLVRALLARGADTDRVNDRGQTALAAAVFRQDQQIVAELLAAGADPRAGARSALVIAEFFGLSEMRELLAQARGTAMA